MHRRSRVAGREPPVQASARVGGCGRRAIDGVRCRYRRIGDGDNVDDAAANTPSYVTPESPRWRVDLCEEQLVMQNLASLRRLGRLTGETAALDALADERPWLLRLQLTAWLSFFDAYGVSGGDAARVLLTFPELLARTDLAEAGNVILAFKSLGWNDRQIASRLLPLYPKVLSGTVAGDVEPVVEALAKAGCEGGNLRLIAWEVPKIFNRHQYRRLIRQFAALNVYGLSASRGAAAVGSERALRATMMLHPFG